MALLRGCGGGYININQLHLHTRLWTLIGTLTRPLRVKLASSPRWAQQSMPPQLFGPLIHIIIKSLFPILPRRDALLEFSLSRQKMFSLIFRIPCILGARVYLDCWSFFYRCCGFDRRSFVEGFLCQLDSCSLFKLTNSLAVWTFSFTVWVGLTGGWIDLYVEF